MSDTRATNMVRAFRSDQRNRDPLLDAVAQFTVGTSMSFGVWLQFLVDGHLIRGRTVSEPSSAEMLDGALSVGFRNLTTADGDPNPEMGNTIADMLDAGYFRAIATRGQETRQNALERIEADEEIVSALDEADLDWVDLDTRKARYVVEAYKDQEALHLAECHMLLDGTWQPLGDFRVALSHVSGWWVVPSTENRDV